MPLKHVLLFLLCLVVFGCAPRSAVAPWKPNPALCAHEKHCQDDGLVERARKDAARQWAVSERKSAAQGMAYLEDSHISYRFHRSAPEVCVKSDWGTCTWRAADGEYLIEIDEDKVDVREAVCHEVWHVLLWEQGIPSTKHHQRMTTCY